MGMWLRERSGERRWSSSGAAVGIAPDRKNDTLGLLTELGAGARVTWELLGSHESRVSSIPVGYPPTCLSFELMCTTESITS
jgi:hypothetical protein